MRRVSCVRGTLAHDRRAGAQAFTLRAWLASLGEEGRRAEALAAVWALMADGTLRPRSGAVLVAGSGASRGCVLRSGIWKQVCPS